MVMRERTKTAKGNRSRAVEKLKGSSQHSSSRKGNREKKAGSSASSMLVDRSSISVMRISFLLSQSFFSFDENDYIESNASRLLVEALCNK